MTLIPFVYRARLARVVDGDTVDLWVDRGFRDYTERRFRLLGVNAAEMHAKDAAEREKAQAAKEWLETTLGVAMERAVELWVQDSAGPWPFLIRTEKADAFGRWLADIWIGDVNVSVAMLAAGHAKPYERSRS